MQTGILIIDINKSEEEEKQLDKDIRNGLIPGYIKPDGTTEMLR